MRHKRENPRPFWQRALLGFIEALQVFGIAGGAAASKPAARITPLSQRIRMREQASSGVRTTSPFVKVEERAIPLAPEPGIAQEKESGSVRYAVRRGDSLWTIAEVEYGSGRRWTDIWNANRAEIREPNLIYPGQNIVVPVEETRGILIQKAAGPRAQKTRIQVSPAFGLLRARVAKQSEALASSLDSVKTETDQISSGEKSAALEDAKKELNALVRKAHELASASSTAETRTALFDTVADILQVERDALKIANNLNQGASPASATAVAPAAASPAPGAPLTLENTPGYSTAFTALNDFALSYVAGESVRANPLQTPHQLGKEITAAAITMIATASTTSRAASTAKISHNPALAQRASELAQTSLEETKKHLAAGEIKEAVTSSVEAVVAAIAANTASPASPEAARAIVSANQAVEAAKTADPSSLTNAVTSLVVSDADGGVNFRGAPPGASLTESNPVLAAEIANAINSPFGIIGRILSPAFIGVPLTIIAGEIRQSLTAQGLNPSTGLPSPAADAGQGMTGENADPTGKSVTGTAQGEAGNIGAVTAEAPTQGLSGSVSPSGSEAVTPVGLDVVNPDIVGHTPLGHEVTILGIQTSPDPLNEDPGRIASAYAKSISESGERVSKEAAPILGVHVVTPHSAGVEVLAGNAAGAAFSAAGRAEALAFNAVTKAAEEIAVAAANPTSETAMEVAAAAKPLLSAINTATRAMAGARAAAEAVGSNTPVGKATLKAAGALEDALAEAKTVAAAVAVVATAAANGTMTAKARMVAASAQRSAQNARASAMTSRTAATAATNAADSLGAAISGISAVPSAVGDVGLGEPAEKSTQQNAPQAPEVPQIQTDTTGQSVTGTAQGKAGNIGAAPAQGVQGQTTTNVEMPVGITPSMIDVVTKTDVTGLSAETGEIAQLFFGIVPNMNPQQQTIVAEILTISAQTAVGLSPEKVELDSKKKDINPLSLRTITATEVTPALRSAALQATADTLATLAESTNNQVFTSAVGEIAGTAVRTGLNFSTTINTTDGVIGVNVVNGQITTTATTPAAASSAINAGLAPFGSFHSFAGGYISGSGSTAATGGTTVGNTPGLTGSVDSSTGAPAGIGDATGTAGVGDTGVSIGVPGGTPDSTSSPAPSMTFSASGATTPVGLAVLGVLGDIGKGNESGIPSNLDISLTPADIQSETNINPEQTINLQSGGVRGGGASADAQADVAPASAISLGLTASDITADANFGIFSGISVSQNGNTITGIGPDGQSAVATIAADGTVTATLSDGTASITISPNGTITSSFQTSDGKGVVTITPSTALQDSITALSFRPASDPNVTFHLPMIPTNTIPGMRVDISQNPQSPLVSATPSITSDVGLAPADVDTATSAELGETGAVDDTSDITLGVQGVVGSAYSAVSEMVASESKTVAGMTSSEAGTRTSAEVAAQNASNPALAGGSMMGNSTSVSTPAGLTGTVGIMGFGAGQLTAMTVTLSNGVTAAFGSNSGTLTSQGLTNSEANQAIALSLQSTQDALNMMSTPRSGQDESDTPGPTTADVDAAAAVDAANAAAGAVTGEPDAGPTAADAAAAAATDAAAAAAGAVTGEPDAGTSGGGGGGGSSSGGGDGPSGASEMCEEEYVVSDEYKKDIELLEKFGMRLGS